MDGGELILAFALQLFIIVDPIAGVPLFLAMTPDNTATERRSMARRGCLVAFAVLSFFLLGGAWLLGYFGVQTAAVRICGGILLFVIALEMLYGSPTGTGTSRREQRLAEAKSDISITPLAVPLLAGPGAIATTLMFTDQVTGILALAGLLAAAAAVFALTYLLLANAGWLLERIGDLGASILTRIMGLLLAFLAVQYIIDGVQAVFRPCG